jgi:hypothetical protein
MDRSGPGGWNRSTQVFDCRDAFDVILGKPWLKAVRAQNDYVTDRITIGIAGEREVIMNLLDIEPTPVLTNVMTDSEAIEMKQKKAQTDTVVPNSQLTTNGNTRVHNKTIEIPPEDQLMKEWTRIKQINTSETSQTEKRWSNLIGEQQQITLDQLPKLIHSEIRLKQLRNLMDTLQEMADSTRNLDNAMVNIIGEVTKDEFRIDRGVNTSARVIDMFAEPRIQEILEAIEIGPDLSDEQREQVRSLVHEYTDIFALTLSEVLYIDLYKHKLSIDPNQTFPT